MGAKSAIISGIFFLNLLSDLDQHTSTWAAMRRRRCAAERRPPPPHNSSDSRVHPQLHQHSSSAFRTPPRYVSTLGQAGARRERKGGCAQHACARTQPARPPAPARPLLALLALLALLPPRVHLHLSCTLQLAARRLTVGADCGGFHNLWCLSALCRS